MFLALRPGRIGHALLALVSFVSASAFMPPRCQDEVQALRDGLYETFSAIQAGDWVVALDVGERTAREAEQALDAAPRDSDEAKVLAEYLGKADWSAARAEHALGRSLDALKRLSNCEGNSAPFARQTRSQLKSLSGAIFIELGLPDLAREPIADAMKLCNEGVVDGPKRDYSAFFDANLGEFRRLLAIASYEDALSALSETESRFDWDNATEKMTPDRANARRAQIEVMRGTALAALAMDDEATLRAARAAFARAVSIDAAVPEDRFIALASLLELDLAARDFEHAERELRTLDEESDAGALDGVSAEDEAWLAALRVRLARLRGDETGPLRARLLEQFDALLDGWRKIDRPGGVGFLRFQGARMLIVELQQGVPAEEKLAIAARAQEFGVLWRGLGQPHPTVSQLRDSLCAVDTGCMIYETGSDEGLLLVVDRDHVCSFALPRFEWIEARVRDLRTGLAGSGPRTPRQERLASEAQRQLVEKLFPVGAREIVAKWKHLRLVGREQLAGLSFGSLRVFEGRALAVTHGLSDLPSLPTGWALLHRRAREFERGSRVVLVGAPEPDREMVARFPVLHFAPLTSAQLQPLIAALPSNATSIFLSDKATVSAVMSARASGDILHLVAHGVLDPLRELRPMIALSPDAMNVDGMLTVERARSSSAPDLVILSVCRSADGVDRLGDVGASHFGGAFLLAGASSVVVADDELLLSDALAIARVMHARLAEHDTTVEALRRAYVELEKQSPARSFWGAQYVFGIGR